MTIDALASKKVLKQSQLSVDVSGHQFGLLFLLRGGGGEFVPLFWRSAANRTERGGKKSKGHKYIYMNTGEAKKRRFLILGLASLNHH